MKIFCERLKALRLEKQITITQLAKEIGVSKLSIFRWENGKSMPNILILLKLAKFFKISSNYLVGLSNKKTNH